MVCFSLVFSKEDQVSFIRVTMAYQSSQGKHQEHGAFFVASKFGLVELLDSNIEMYIESD